MTAIILRTPEDTERMGKETAEMLQAPAVVFLEGPLGAGKTTFVRGFLRGLGYEGSVKSPTYTLIEHYDLNGRLFLHADLYRIKDPEELELIGFREYFDSDTICLIEWASHAADWLPVPTLRCSLNILAQSGGRSFEREWTKK